MTNELRLTAEDGTEYVLPGDFFAGPLKPGTRGTWWDGSRCEIVAGSPDSQGRAIIMDDGDYYRVLAGDVGACRVGTDYGEPPRTPDPEPPTTVMVEMSVSDAQQVVFWRGLGARSAGEALDRIADAAAKALREAGA